MSNGSRKKNVHPHSQQPGKSKNKYERGDGQYNPDHEGASPASKMVGPGQRSPEEIGGMLRRESKRADTARRKAAFGKKVKASKGTVSHRKQQRDFGPGGYTVDQMRDSKKADKARASRKSASKEVLATAASTLLGGVAGAAIKGGVKAASLANKARKAANVAKKVNTARKAARTSKKVSAAGQKARTSTRLKKVAAKDFPTGKMERSTFSKRRPSLKETGKVEVGTRLPPRSKSVSKASKYVSDKAKGKAAIKDRAQTGAVLGATAGFVGGLHGSAIRLDAKDKKKKKKKK